MRQIPSRWHEEADVVVVGYGGAGAATAITARDRGVDVLILEKAPEGEEGGNTKVSGNVFLSPERTPLAYTYIRALCQEYEVPESMVHVWVDEMTRNFDWVRSLGGQPVEREALAREFPDLPGIECVHVYVNGPIDRLTEVSRATLWQLLKDCVEQRAVRVLYGTPGKRLFQHPETNEILGVLASRAGKDIAVKARRAVVLTCGGFENNPQMVRDYLTSLPYCYPKGTPHNTGDGIKMALDVGADLWHMHNIAGPQYSFRAPELDVVMYPRRMPGNSYIYVAGTAERFVFEQAYMVNVPGGGHRYPVKHGKIWRHGQWVPSPTPTPMFCIFDEKTRARGPIYGHEARKLGWVEHHDLYTWSEDNSKEIAKGWITRSHTIGDLAGKLGLEAAKLEETVNRYNSYCRDKKDPDFNRDPGTLDPIDKPPFCGMPLVPNFINTQGGPRRNEKAQIVNPFCEPIPRLYSSGELGSIYAFLYQGGGNIGECLAFGRIAGRNAAAEKPWA